jgi:hypothetical protein
MRHSAKNFIFDRSRSMWYIADTKQRGCDLSGLDEKY